ncbi:MAG: porin family protein [Bacteroidota bacterium]
MKKLIVASVMTVGLLANSAGAQEMPWSFGLKAGIVNSQVGGLGKAEVFGPDNAQNSLLKLGMHAGMFGSYKFQSNMRAGLEVMYAGIGGKLSMKGDAKQFCSFTTHQVSMTPLLHFMPMASEYGESEGINIHVGPEFNFPLMTKANYSLGQQAGTMPVKEGMARFGFGAVLGLGYESPLGMLLEFRANYSLTDILEKQGVVKSQIVKLDEDQGTKAWGVRLSMGYNFANLLMQ